MSRRGKTHHDSIGVPYVRDDYPQYKDRPWRDYRPLPDFDPPATWDKFDMNDPRWDAHFLSVNGPSYVLSSLISAGKPVDVHTTVWMMGKAYARTRGFHAVGNGGMLFWGNWPTIDPCWLIVTHAQTIKLRTEAELKLPHDEAWQAWVISKKQPNQ